MVTPGAIGNIVTIHYGNNLELWPSQRVAFPLTEPHVHFSPLHPCPTHANPEDHNPVTLVDSFSSVGKETSRIPVIPLCTLILP